MVNGWNFARGKPLLQKTGLRGKLLVAWLRVNIT